MLRNRNSVDEAIEGLRGSMTASSSGRFKLDDDNGGTFREVELDDFRFHDGSSSIAVRPKRKRARDRRRRVYE